MLADALNWAGVNEDAFQASLDGCNSEQERAALITDTLNGLYQEAADNYKELNGDVMEAQRAQALLTDAYAQLGAIAEPIMTTLKTMAADVLTAMIPFVSLMGEGLQGVLEGTAGAAETFAEGVSGLADVLMEKLSTIVPMIGEALLASLPVLLEAGANIITTLVGGIVAALPELAAAALSIILQLVTSLTELLPQILAAAMQVVATLAQGIGTAMPTLIPAVVQLVVQRQYLLYCRGRRGEEQPEICAVPLQAHQCVKLRHIYQHPGGCDAERHQLLFFELGAVQSGCEFLI